MQGDPQRTNSARWVVRFCAPLLRCTHLRTVRRCRTSCALPPMCRTHSRRTHARRAARWRRLCSNSADCDTANGYSDKQNKVDKVHSNPNISFHICKTNSGVIEMINNMARHNLININRWRSDQFQPPLHIESGQFATGGLRLHSMNVVMSLNVQCKLLQLECNNSKCNSDTF